MSDTDNPVSVSRLSRFFRPLPWTTWLQLVLLAVQLVPLFIARHYSHVLAAQRQVLAAQQTKLERLMTEADGLLRLASPSTGAPPSPANAMIPKNSIFHAPAAGCPEGTTRLAEFFRRDGKNVDACRNPNGDGTIDVLNPGESFGLSLLIPDPDPPAPPQKGTRL